MGAAVSERQSMERSEMEFRVSYSLQFLRIVKIIILSLWQLTSVLLLFAKNQIQFRWLLCIETLIKFCITRELVARTCEEEDKRMCCVFSRLTAPAKHKIHNSVDFVGKMEKSIFFKLWKRCCPSKCCHTTKARMQKSFFYFQETGKFNFHPKLFNFLSKRI